MPKLRIGSLNTLRFTSGEGAEAKQILIIHGDGGELHPEGAMVEDRGRVLVQPEGQDVFEEVLVTGVLPDNEYRQVTIAFSSDRNHGFTMMHRPGGILDFNGDRYRGIPVKPHEEVDVQLLSGS